MSSRQLLMPRNGRDSVNAILQPAQSSAVMGTGYEHVRSGIKSTVPLPCPLQREVIAVSFSPRSLGVSL